MCDHGAAPALVNDPGLLSVLPPVLAIVVALVTRQAVLALLAGVLFGELVIGGGNPFAALANSVTRITDAFSGNAHILLFSTLVGAVLALIGRIGGVAGFVEWVTARRLGRSRRGAEALALLLGLGIFVESSITCLVSGTVARPLFDRFRLSREKLAYLTDSTSAPVCILIPLNGWGALVIAILATLGIENGVRVLAASIPFNFYALAALALAFWFGLSGRDFGPMARAQRRARETGRVIREGARPLVSAEVLALPPAPGVAGRARNMIVPLAVLLVMIFVGLWITGEGDLLAGSGSVSVLWAVLAATLTAALLGIAQRAIRPAASVDLVFRGASGMVPVVSVLLVSFAIAAVARDLGTGVYLAGVAEAAMPAWLVPAALFVVASATAFSTGTSWGTFGIMLPIAIPAGAALGLDAPLVLGAVLSGGIFGDHCSPISDTTIIASMASGSDLVDHVNTQLPYALLGGGAAVLLFLAAGLLSGPV